MLNLFSKYKYALLAIVFAIYSAGLWHVSSVYSTADQLKESLKVANDNQTIRDEISRTLQESLAKSTKQIADANRQVVNEIRTDPVYKSCRITDGVRESYKRALKAQ